MESSGPSGIQPLYPERDYPARQHRCTWRPSCRPAGHDCRPCEHDYRPGIPRRGTRARSSAGVLAGPWSRGYIRRGLALWFGLRVRLRRVPRNARLLHPLRVLVPEALEALDDVFNTGQMAGITAVHARQPLVYHQGLQCQDVARPDHEEGLVRRDLFAGNSVDDALAVDGKL